MSSTRIIASDAANLGISARLSNPHVHAVADGSGPSSIEYAKGSKLQAHRDNTASSSVDGQGQDSTNLEQLYDTQHLPLPQSGEHAIHMRLHQVASLSDEGMGDEEMSDEEKDDKSNKPCHCPHH